jgi:hypothetical protein
MANKRMFSQQITNSDAFLDMPTSSQNLYFHLNMNADDDGFVSSPKTVMRITSAKDDDLKILIAKKFIIPFDSGIVVIKHWRINNYIRSDRYKPTAYVEEFSRLYLKDNNSYTVDSTQGIPMADVKKLPLDPIKKELDIDVEEAEEEIEVIPKTSKKQQPKQDNWLSIEEQITNKTEDLELREILRQFVEMRIKMKKKPTNYAFFLLLNKLDKLAVESKCSPKDIINQSIENSWQDLYALKEDYSKNKPNYKKDVSKLPSWYEKYQEEMNGTQQQKEKNTTSLSQQEIDEILKNAKEKYK